MTWVDSTDLTEARPGLVNAIRYEYTANNGTSHEGWLVWLAIDETCCPTQAGWPAERMPAAYTPSGVGDTDIASFVQCGGCASLIFPPHSRLVAADADLGAVAAEIVAGRAADLEAMRAKIFARIQRDLDDAVAAVAAGADLEDFVTGSEVHPGVYVERGRQLVSWDFDPADTDESDTIAVSAGVEGGVA